MKKQWLSGMIAAIAFVLCFGTAAWSEEGVTDTEIHIGQWGPQTGPAAPWGAVARGTDAYFKMINEAGGIHGRKLVLHYFDDAYNPAKTKAGVKQLQEEVGMFAWVSGVGTACGLAVKDYLAERGIPWIGPSSGSTHWVDPPNKYLFSVYPLYQGDARLLCRYATKQLGLKRIAICYQNDDYGKQGVEGARFQLAGQHMKLVAQVPVAVSDTDMKPHIMKLRQAKAEAVLLFVGPAHLARLIGTGKAMQFEPQWMSSTTCADFPLMMYLTKGACRGLIVAGYGMVDPVVGSIEDVANPTLPLMKTYYEKAFKKYAAENERWGLTFAAGIAYAEPLVECLKRCGRDLTRDRLVAEMEKLKNFKGIMGRISFKPFEAGNPGSRQGQSEIFLARCDDKGRYEILTDWETLEYVSNNK